MSEILVFTESQNGQLKRSSKELLSFAQSCGKTFSSVVWGPGASELGFQAAAYGGVANYVVSGLDSAPNPEVLTAVAADLIAQSGTRLILGSASALGKDFFPRLAARTKGALVSDCTGLSFQDGSLLVQKPLFAGKIFSQVKFQPECLQLVLMRANQLPLAEPKGPAAPRKDLSAPSINLKSLVKEVVKGASEKLDLTEANIIVAGGRGLKEAQNFKLLNDLADVLGATVGASRAVVDAGWVPHSMQVGQTGKTVAPTLYIAAGISGAIQHLAGMSGAKVIVAINNDANAPIFQKANYGLVGDLFELIPLLTEEFKKVLQK